MKKFAFFWACILLRVYINAIDYKVQGIDSLITELSKSEKGTIAYYQTIKKIGEFYYSEENYPQALKYSQQALNFFNDKDSLKTSGYIYLTIGDIYSDINDYNNSLSNYFDATKKFEEANNQELVAQSKIKVASIYLRLDNYSKSLSNLYESKKYYEKSRKNKSIDLIQIYTILGSTYGYMEKTDSALFYFNKALDITPKKDLINSAILINNIGAVYSKQNDFKSALKKYNEVLSLAEQSNYKKLIGVTLSNIAYLYKKENKFSLATSYYLQAIDTLRLTGDLYYLKDIYQNLSEIYEAEKNFEKAYLYLDKYQITSDSLISEETIGQTANLESKYQITKLDKQMNLLQRENEIKQFKQYVLAGSLIIILLLAFFVFRNLREKIKNRQLNEKILEQEKENLKREIEFKNKEIENFAFRIIQKNDFLEKLEEEINLHKKEGSFQYSDLLKISKNIHENLYIAKDKVELEAKIENIQKSFFYKLNEKFPALTENEKKLCSLIVLDLSLKDVALINNISPDSVKKSRYRLRKKLGLSADESLSEFLKTL